MTNSRSEKAHGIVRTNEEGAAQAEHEPGTKGYAPFLENPGWDCCIVPFPYLYATKGNSEHSKDDKERNDPTYTRLAEQNHDNEGTLRMGNLTITPVVFRPSPL